MSDSKEKEEAGEDMPAAVLDNGQSENAQEIDHNKHNDSSDSGESAPVPETPNSVESTEALSNKIDIEMTTDDKDNLEPRLDSHQSEQESPPPSVPLNGSDQQLVEQLEPGTEPLNGNDHLLVKVDTEVLKDDDRQLFEPDSEPLKDDDRQLVKPDTEPVKEDDQQLVKPDAEPLKDDDQNSVKSDAEPLTDDGQQLVKPDTEPLKDDDQQLVKSDAKHTADAKTEDQDLAQSNNHGCEDGDTAKIEARDLPQSDNHGCEDGDTAKTESQESPQSNNHGCEDGDAAKTEAQVLHQSNNHGCEDGATAKTEAQDLPQSNNLCCVDVDTLSTSHQETAEPTVGVKTEASQVPKGECGGAVTVGVKPTVGDTVTVNHNEPVMPHAGSSDIKADTGSREELKNKVDEKDITTPKSNGNPNLKCPFLLVDSHMSEGNDSGTEADQSAFMIELENFFRERSMVFKPPKFYGEGLNCLKLWRAVTRLGGYDKVTSSKLWRQVGETFRPPKTCTTVSWTFRGFYEKALLDYERHIFGTEPIVPISSQPEAMNIDNQASGSGRTRRDAAARAMQGWHSQRILGSGEVTDPIIKDKNAIALQKPEKQLKSIGSLKRKKPPHVDHVVKVARTKPSKLQLDADVVDLGPPADWVKVNVQRTKDCFEIYALVPGLLREEVRVQSDPAGRLVISGEPVHPNNPWGVTPFKKVVTLPSRIDPHQTSAVVTLHGQLFVRVPFESE